MATRKKPMRSLLSTAQDKKDSGYSKDELTFIEEPPKLLELECPICLQVMLNDPHLVSCCGHHFCGPCIKKIQSRNEPCPLCKENSYQAMVDKSTQRNINGLHIYCINNKEGCKWKGELKDLSSHLQQGKREGECQYVRVQCKYAKTLLDIFFLTPQKIRVCGVMGQRYEVSRHEANDCPNRPYSCKYCYQKDTFCSITEKHYSECRNYPVSCPNNCKEDKMPRYQLKDHLDISCLLQPVECEFSWAGCKVKTIRQDLTKHYADHLQQHLSLACKELKRENEALKKENADLKEDIATIKETLELW